MGGWETSRQAAPDCCRRRHPAAGSPAYLRASRLASHTARALPWLPPRCRDPATGLGRLDGFILRSQLLVLLRCALPGVPVLSRTDNTR